MVRVLLEINATIKKANDESLMKGLLKWERAEERIGEAANKKEAANTVYWMD